MRLQNQLYEQKIRGGENETRSERMSKKGNESPRRQTQEDEIPHDPTTDRVKELMSDLLHMRKRLKKEEESRKQFSEIARKKDEELKKLRADIQLSNQRFQDEEVAKNRERNIV